MCVSLVCVCQSFFSLSLSVREVLVCACVCESFLSLSLCVRQCLYVKVLHTSTFSLKGTFSLSCLCGSV
jgi:hypothetical protein